MFACAVPVAKPGAGARETVKWPYRAPSTVMALLRTLDRVQAGSARAIATVVRGVLTPGSLRSRLVGLGGSALPVAQPMQSGCSVTNARLGCMSKTTCSDDTLEVSDESLMAEYAAGRVEAFEELVPHGALLRRVHAAHAFVPRRLGARLFGLRAVVRGQSGVLGRSLRRLNRGLERGAVVRRQGEPRRQRQSAEEQSRSDSRHHLMDLHLM